MVRPRSSAELDLMRKSGVITALALNLVLENIKPGITGLEIEELASKEIKDSGGELAFAKVPGYKWATCVTVNEQVVHGIPTSRELKAGDILGIDLGAIYKGWYSDAAWSVMVGESSDGKRKKFLEIGEQALWDGIAQAKEGSRIGDISHAIQAKVEGAGYGVVRSLVGHGVGRALHEEPEVPGFGKAGTGMVLKAGMSLAIEVIYTEGSPDIVLEQDDWTISTSDHSLGGLFEMTVIVGKEKPEVLTDWRKI